MIVTTVNNIELIEELTLAKDAATKQKAELDSIIACYDCGSTRDNMHIPFTEPYIPCIKLTGWAGQHEYDNNCKCVSDRISNRTDIDLRAYALSVPDWGRHILKSIDDALVEINCRQTYMKANNGSLVGCVL